MLRTLSLSIFTLLLVSPFAVAQDFAGDWSGVLATDGGDLEVILHISEGADGLEATLDVPQQGASGIAASSASAEGERLSLEFSEIQTTVAGTKTADGTIDATWSQAGKELPLTLTPAERGFEGEAAPEKAPEEAAAPEDAPAPEEAATPEDAPEEAAIPEEAPGEEAVPDRMPEEKMPEAPENR